jgi:N-acyl-D-aspartate/D-glutamate deacylase/CubicO group peptidase (beta-lactamase class C family)
MVRLIAPVIATLFFAPVHAGVPNARTLRVGVDARQADAIDTIVREEMLAQRIPGMAVAVIRGGNTVSVKGYGLANVEHNVPVTDETIFQSGSVGKQFTAAAVMLQVEDGKLALSDPLIKFFPNGPAAWHDITVRHLLTHTSGVPDYNDGLLDYRKDYSEDDLVKFASTLTLDFTPGSEWKYSNTAYQLLGIIVRRVSGSFYGEVLRDRVFAPLGMTTARIISEADIVAHRAAGYRLERGTLRNQEWVSPTLNTTADGSLYLSLRDLVAWDRGIRTGAVLRAHSWRQMFTAVTLNSGRTHPYGFGFEVDRIAGRDIQRHGGSWQGFKTYIARYGGEDITVIALANLAQANPKKVVDRIAASLMPSLTTATGWVIRGAQLADGTGSPLRRADVRFESGTIVDVGTVSPQPGDRVIDATGLVLAPGVIDAHNHSTDGLDADPDAITQVAQGITTLAVGQDGSSPFPLAEYLARRRANPSTVNVVALAGHATLRRRVMGDDFRRPAAPAEIVQLEALVDQEMRSGAIGLSSGLEYEVGSYASTEEVVAMARVAARHGGFYISHIRDEADKSMEAIREAIAIGEKAKIAVQITHLKLGTVGVWGKAADVVSMIEAARKRGVDVTADVYPYTAWSSNLKVLVPDKQWTNPASVKEALDDVGGGRNIQITRLQKYPHYVGKRLDEIASAEGLSEVDLYIRIVQEDDAGVIGHTMIADDMRAFMQQPWAMIASDGGINTSHPRGAGTFPRVLGRFVREEKWLSLPEAIRKMTSMPAARLKLKDRGTVAVGMKADLLLFDPNTVIDRSTFEQPRLRPRGVHRVFVNGKPVWTGDSPDGERPGAVLNP